jgi:hypothetical protein
VYLHCPLPIFLSSGSFGGLFFHSSALVGDLTLGLCSLSCGGHRTLEENESAAPWTAYAYRGGTLFFPWLLN